MATKRFQRGLIAALVLATLPVIAGEPGEDARRLAQSRRLPEGVKAFRDLEYAKTPQKTLRLDLFVPEKIVAPVPVIVWIHGGAWRAGNKTNSPALPFAAKGYAVASIIYRFSQEAIFPAQVHDCKAAIRWLRAHAAEYKLDAGKIGVWGSSAGGHLAALLGTTGGVKELEGELGNPEFSSRVQAVCDWFGPSDFLKMNEQAGTGGKMNHDAPDSPESKLIGGAIQQNKEKAAKASPLSYVTQDDAPFLMMHGDLDPLVPLAQSQMLRDVLDKAGVAATLHVVKGAGHGFDGDENLKKVESFFEQHLKTSAEARKDATPR